MEQILNDRLTAISGKLDIVLNRQAENEAKIHDVLIRLAGLPNPPSLKGRFLGKKQARKDPRTLQLAKYLEEGIVAPPASRSWTSGITKWGMMLNDTLGDCTIAACGHAVQGVSAANGLEITLPDWIILHYYEAWDGYVLGNPSTDQGGFELDVLNDWRKYGFGYRKSGLGTSGLLGYVDPSVGNETHIKQSINLFGGVYIGLAMPITAQTQIVWDVVAGNNRNTQPGSWGGHAVWCLGYTSTHITCVSWGQLIDMTWAFWLKYCDEAHTLLLTDWLKNTTAPSGFNLAQLKSDLAAVTA